MLEQDCFCANIQSTKPSLKMSNNFVGNICDADRSSRLTAASAFATSNVVDRPTTALNMGRPTVMDNYKEAAHFRPQTTLGLRPKDHSSINGAAAAVATTAANNGHHNNHVSNRRLAPPTKSSKSAVVAGQRRQRRRRHRRRGLKKELRVVKSCELRAGVHYLGCGCVKLNGLQDDCRRRECTTWHGNPKDPCFGQYPADCAPSSHYRQPVYLPPSCTM